FCYSLPSFEFSSSLLVSPSSPPETILALRRTLNATAEGLATTSTVLDGEEGDTSNDEENSNDVVTVEKTPIYNEMNDKDA
ncbi:unnamed protein product, partial [Adineta steineri]